MEGCSSSTVAVRMDLQHRRFVSVDMSVPNCVSWNQVIWNGRYGPTLVVIPPAVMCRIPLIQNASSCDLMAGRDRVYKVKLEKTNAGTCFGKGWEKATEELRLDLGTVVQFGAVHEHKTRVKFSVKCFRTVETLEGKFGTANLETDAGEEHNLYDNYTNIDLSDKCRPKWCQVIGNKRYGEMTIRIPAVIRNMLPWVPGEQTKFLHHKSKIVEYKTVNSNSGEFSLIKSMGVGVTFTAILEDRCFLVEKSTNVLEFDGGRYPMKNVDPDLGIVDARMSSLFHASESSSGDFCNAKMSSSASSSKESLMDVDWLSSLFHSSESSSHDFSNSKMSRLFTSPSSSEERESQMNNMCVDDIETFDRTVGKGCLYSNGTVTLPTAICKQLLGPGPCSKTIKLRTLGCMSDFSTTVHYYPHYKSTKLSGGWTYFARTTGLRMGDMLRFKVVELDPEIVFMVTKNPQ